MAFKATHKAMMAVTVCTDTAPPLLQPLGEIHLTENGEDFVDFSLAQNGSGLYFQKMVKGIKTGPIYCVPMLDFMKELTENIIRGE